MESNHGDVPVELEEMLQTITDPTLQFATVQGVVVLKIIEHCTGNLPELVSGQLLGLDIGRQLEITHSFPFLTTSNESEAQGEVERYQINMMRCLREVNVDNNSVGWYQSTYLGQFVSDYLIDSQYNYQISIPKAVVLVFDPLKTMQEARLSLYTYRLTPSFMELYQGGSFTKDSLVKAKFSSSHIFEKIPLAVTNLSMVNAFLHQICTTTNSIGRQLQPDFAPLDISVAPFLEKNLESMIETLDELASEQQKYYYYLRRQGPYQKRREVEDDKQPNQLEALLLTSQLNNYCDQLNYFASKSLKRMFLVGTMQKTS